jgi:hypothetical protein
MSPIINKRLEKPRRSNLKFMSAVNNEIKQTVQFTVLPILRKILVIVHFNYFWNFRVFSG